VRDSRYGRIDHQLSKREFWLIPSVTLPDFTALPAILLFQNTHIECGWSHPFYGSYFFRSRRLKATKCIDMAYLKMDIIFSSHAFLSFVYFLECESSIKFRCKF